MEVKKYIMIYQLKKNLNQLRVLGEEFVNSNRNKGKLIKNNKKCPLISLIDINESKNVNFKLEMILSKGIYNKSFMFKNCKNLLKLSIDYNLEKEENLYDYQNFEHTKEKNSFENNNNNININNNIYSIFNYSKNFSGNNYSEIEILFDNSEKFEILNIYNEFKNYNTNYEMLSGMFYNCSSLISLEDISKYDTSYVTNMSKMFSRCSSLISLPDISKWNTSSVTDMIEMFSFCSSLTSLPDIQKWNMNNVIDRYQMCFQCFSVLDNYNLNDGDDENEKGNQDLFVEDVEDYYYDEQSQKGEKENIENKDEIEEESQQKELEKEK